MTPSSIEPEPAILNRLHVCNKDAYFHNSTKTPVVFFTVEYTLSLVEAEEPLKHLLY